jgi:hypothetical protein
VSLGFLEFEATENAGSANDRDQDSHAHRQYKTAFNGIQKKHQTNCYVEES